MVDFSIPSPIWCILCIGAVFTVHVYTCSTTDTTGGIVSQQAMVEDTMGQSNVLTTYYLTDDDKQFIAHSTTQHIDNYQEQGRS